MRRSLFSVCRLLLVSLIVLVVVVVAHCCVTSMLLAIVVCCIVWLAFVGGCCWSLSCYWSFAVGNRFFVVTLILFRIQEKAQKPDWLYLCLVGSVLWCFVFEAVDVEPVVGGDGAGDVVVAASAAAVIVVVLVRVAGQQQGTKTVNSKQKWQNT